MQNVTVTERKSVSSILPVPTRTLTSIMVKNFFGQTPIDDGILIAYRTSDETLVERKRTHTVPAATALCSGAWQIPLLTGLLTTRRQVELT
jgi:hypothetical protein